jgi:hypothetical protein
VTMVTGWMSVNFYGYNSRVWRSVGCRRVYLAMDSFEVGRLSSYWETARGAREFIPWTVKTFDRRGW